MLKKKYVKSRDVCKVAFVVAKKELPEDVDVENIHLVGDFNDWKKDATPMRENSKGDFRVEIDLTPDSVYQFRYLINNTDWYNDWEADEYRPNDQGGDNCVVKTLAKPE
jgi:1,4-alpha-glucan branching enzyme